MGCLDASFGCLLDAMTGVGYIGFGAYLGGGHADEVLW